MLITLTAFCLAGFLLNITNQVDKRLITIKIRLLLDAVITVACSTLAAYFIWQWFKHGLPLYGYDDMLGGSRKTLLPFLWPAIILFGVALTSAFDFYAHKN